ncbi:MAG: DUF4411 family protein [Albidovulum sp.]|nr:DUF4411 family protein [Albidovulum sp.]
MRSQIARRIPGYQYQFRRDRNDAATDCRHRSTERLRISNADPFGFARATLNGADRHVVSSEKAEVGNSRKNPNIPFTCGQIGVKSIRFLDMLRMENWKLS